MTDTLKNKLRKEIKEYRAALDPIEKKNMDRAVFENLISSGILNEKKLLLTYISTPIETQTGLIISFCIENGISVAVPKCRGDRQMDFYYYDERHLEKSAFGIYEPDIKKCRLAERLENAVCIVPGLAFDKKGFRLGYGGGYYDTFLEKHPEVTAVGICYQANITESLPAGAYDKQVNFIVTDKFTEEYDG